MCISLKVYFKYAIKILNFIILYLEQVIVTKISQNSKELYINILDNC